MKFILINNEGPSKTVEIGRWTRVVVSAFLIGLPVSLAGLSYEFGMKKGVARAQAAEETLAAEEARERAEALADMAVEAERRLESMTLLLAELQNDSVSLADLQQKVLHGEVYLNRCQKLLDSVYSAGDTQPAMDAYIGFRGREPSVEPLLRNRGFIEAEG